MDFGLGTVFSTPWINGFHGHLKAFYWFNRENEDKVKAGNETKFIAKVDYGLHKQFLLFFTFIYYGMGNSEIAGIEKENSNKWRTYLHLGGVLKPMKGIFISPKVVYHLGGENKIIFNLLPILDAWFVF